MSERLILAYGYAVIVLALLGSIAVLASSIAHVDWP
jgi:hypothetical protein